MPGKDELVDLGTAFNSMAKGLSEREKMTKYLSKAAVESVKGNANTIMGGKLIKAAILFSDIRSFTTVSEKLEPESLVKLINIYFDLQTKIIEKYGGIVDKFVGDQIMALFLEEEMADQAVQAAVEFQKEIRKLNTKRKKANKEILQVGIGIHYGPVMIGSMGTKTRMDYTAIGDTVNLGARLCSIAKPGQIVIPQKMIRRLKGSYSIVKMEPLILKGRNRPVQLYSVNYD